MLHLKRCFLLAMVCLVPLFAQAQSAAPELPPGWVDGSKNPQLIPDHASYRLILMHLSEVMSDTGPRAALRQDNRFKRIGLSDTDTQTLKTYVALFTQDYNQWKTKAGTNPSEQDDATAKAMVLATRDMLLKSLTPDGVGKLVKYIEGEKVRMVVKP